MVRARYAVCLVPFVVAACAAASVSPARSEQVEQPRGIHVAVEGGLSVPAAPSSFASDWKAGALFGFAVVAPSSDAGAWTWRLSSASWPYRSVPEVESRIGLTSLAFGYRRLLGTSALEPFVRASAGAASVTWQDVETFANGWGSTGTRGWGGVVELGAGVRPYLARAAVRPYADVGWTGAWARVVPRGGSLHAVWARLGVEFEPASADSLRAHAPAARPGAPRGARLPGGWYACGGLALPTGVKGAPDAWSSGLSLAAGAEFPMVARAAIVVGLEQDWLPFDAGRFRRSLGWPSNSTVTGDAASVGLVTMGLRLALPTGRGWDLYGDAYGGWGTLTAKLEGRMVAPGEYAYVRYTGTESGWASGAGLGLRRASPEGRVVPFVDVHWTSLGILDGAWRYASVRAGVAVR